MSRGVSASIREVMGASRVALGRLPARLQSLLTPGGRVEGPGRENSLASLTNSLSQMSRTGVTWSAGLITVS
jgi:hypothetical protein